jgi:hypothetical protein
MILQSKADLCREIITPFFELVLSGDCEEMKKTPACQGSPKRYFFHYFFLQGMFLHNPGQQRV